MMTCPICDAPVVDVLAPITSGFCPACYQREWDIAFRLLKSDPEAQNLLTLQSAVLRHFRRFNTRGQMKVYEQIKRAISEK